MPSVAYLGPDGTNTHAAALRAFGDSARYVPSSTISDVFGAVESRQVDHGVVPVENSTEGVVRETVDCLLSRPPLIEREVELEIRHDLMGPAGVAPAEATRVVSHPQALAQCRLWLEQHYPWLVPCTATSTAAAAVEAKGRSDTLAIASSLAAAHQSLTVHASGIADRSHNTTRFICLSTTDAAPTGQDRTTLVLKTPHERGALHRLLGVLDEAGVNMTRIESRPLAERRWEYAFVVDVEGHRAESPLRETLESLHEANHLVRVLGSYPRAR